MNLIHIESRPAKTSNEEYEFFVDCDNTKGGLKESIKVLKENGCGIKLLARKQLSGSGEPFKRVIVISLCVDLPNDFRMENACMQRKDANHKCTWTLSLVVLYDHYIASIIVYMSFTYTLYRITIPCRIKLSYMFAWIVWQILSTRGYNVIVNGYRLLV